LRDPYLYEDAAVLRNLGNIKDAAELKQAESDITKHSLSMVYGRRFDKFNTNTICDIHRTIFMHLYEWAGEFRTIPIAKREDILGGDTVRYAYPKEIKKELDATVKEIAKLKKADDKKDLIFKIVRLTAKLWQTHPFREGNTRTIIVFAILLAEHLGIEIDHVLFEEHAGYVRNALVWAAQGIYSKFEYLEGIFYDAAEIENNEVGTAASNGKDYTKIGDYNVADYVETPHTYLDEDEQL
jgi:cell filamentation protein